MLIRSLITVCLVCGMLLAPAAMAAGRGDHPSSGHAVGHRTHGVDGDQHTPVKHVQCMGACCAVAPEAPVLAGRAVSQMAAVPASAVSPLHGVPLEREKPPPRRA